MNRRVNVTRQSRSNPTRGSTGAPSFYVWCEFICMGARAKVDGLTYRFMYGRLVHESTGAEIETALCILESVLPTLVSTRYYTRKLGSGNLWVPLAASCDPSAKRGPPWGPRKLGNSESGIWDSICLGPKRGPRKLGNSETGIWGSLGRGPKRGAPRKLGNSESGIWVYLQTGPKRGPRKLGNSESGICREYPGICTLGILESGICGGVSRNLYIWNVGIF